MSPQERMTLYTPIAENNQVGPASQIESGWIADDSVLWRFLGVTPRGGKHPSENEEPKRDTVV
jgi:hypothetical protein